MGILVLSGMSSDLNASGMVERYSKRVCRDLWECISELMEPSQNVLQAVFGGREGASMRLDCVREG